MEPKNQPTPKQKEELRNPINWRHYEGFRICPWCDCLTANLVESMHAHAQWHVTHMVAHNKDPE